MTTNKTENKMSNLDADDITLAVKNGEIRTVDDALKVDPTIPHETVCLAVSEAIHQGLVSIDSAGVLHHLKDSAAYTARLEADKGFWLAFMTGRVALTSRKS